MKKQLKDCSTKELEAELRRRKGINYDNWYFSFDEDSDNVSPAYQIIHKRAYHIDHHMDQGHIESILQIPRFTEIMAGTFAPDDACSIEEGRRKLLNLGFKELEDGGDFIPVSGLGLYHIVKFENGDKNKLYDVRFNYVCDTHEIWEYLNAKSHEHAEFSHRDPGKFKDLESYQQWIVDIMKDDWILIEEGRSHCFIERSVYESLPPRIDIEEDEDV